MNSFFKTAVAVAAVAAATQAAAQITFYENDGFQGRNFTAQGAVDNFRSSGFNDRASSVVVQSNRWEVCDTPSSADAVRCCVPAAIPHWTRWASMTASRRCAWSDELTVLTRTAMRHCR